MNKIGCAILALGLVIGGIALAARQCAGPPGSVEFEVRRESANVSTGATHPLQPLTDSGFRALPDGHYVTTDASGEALLRGKTDGATCNVYLFDNSGLAKRACSKSSYSGGSTSCLEAGSARYQNCSSHLIMTPSGEVRVEGSWVWVTYLPQWQLTLVVVAEGRATVWPVVEFEARRLGTPVVLQPGEFLYTAPDSSLPEVGELLSLDRWREPRAVDELPVLIGHLGIERWFQKALDRATRDGIPPERFPPGPGEEPPPSAGLSIVLRGGSLDDDRVREAVLYAVPWAEIAKEVFRERDPRMSVELHGTEMNVWEVPHDPDKARGLLAEAGFQDGIRLRVLYAQDDGQLGIMAEWMIKNLQEAGIRALLQPVPAPEAEAHVKELAAAGEAVLWLAWR